MQQVHWTLEINLASRTRDLLPEKQDGGLSMICQETGRALVGGLPGSNFNNSFGKAGQEMRGKEMRSVKVKCSSGPRRCKKY